MREDHLCPDCGHRITTHYDDGCIQCDGCREPFSTIFDRLLAEAAAGALRKAADGLPHLYNMSAEQNRRVASWLRARADGSPRW